MSLIVAGIHTGIGKTICSSILCQALGYEYFKPVQAGDLESTDSMQVKRLVSHPRCKIHPEIYKLNIPASPHYAAEQEGIEIKEEKLVLPISANQLVVETAGGLMSPLSSSILNVDLIRIFNLPVVLVSNNYLGSINHTLLSFELLKSKQAKVIGIVFNGETNQASESYILNYTKLPHLFSVPQFSELNAAAIENFANTISLSI